MGTGTTIESAVCQTDPASALGWRTVTYCTENEGTPHHIRSRVPARTKAKMKAVATEHMERLEKSPDRVRSYFQDPRVKYAA
jgi:hypothetical protein